MRVPRVSIGLPVYNGAKYLRLAVHSVLQQDYTDLELIISDNASTDHTEDICREYAAKDKRIRYYRNDSNIGATGNFNRVFKLSRGEYFKWLPCDDECYPSLVRRCLETFQHSSRDTVLVCARSEIIDETGRLMHVSQLKMASSPKPFARLTLLLLNRGYPHPIWGLIRSEVLRQTRLMGTVEADHVLLAELALLGNIVEVRENLQRWRIHSQNALKVNRTPRQLLAWHDPTRAKSIIVLPHWLRWDLEYCRCIRHSPLARTERLLCHAGVFGCSCGRWFLTCRNKLALRTRLKRLFRALSGRGAWQVDRSRRQEGNSTR
jgi:glycosyltransferase involved in cell wall biosynthesis